MSYTDITNGNMTIRTYTSNNVHYEHKLSIRDVEIRFKKLNHKSIIEVVPGNIKFDYCDNDNFMRAYADGLRIKYHSEELKMIGDGVGYKLNAGHMIDTFNIVDTVTGKNIAGIGSGGAVIYFGDKILSWAYELDGALNENEK